MYRIFHKLFGWDYVLWRHDSGTYGIARIRQFPDEKYYIIRFPFIDSGLVDLNDESDMSFLKLTYLTCDPSKYVK